MVKIAIIRWAVNKRSIATDNATKRYTLEIYLKGLGFKVIGRILGFSSIAVDRHTKKCVNFNIGKQDAKSGIKLWYKINNPRYQNDSNRLLEAIRVFCISRKACSIQRTNLDS